MSKWEKVMRELERFVSADGEDNARMEFILVAFAHVVKMADRVTVVEDEDGSMRFIGPGVPELHVHALCLLAILTGLYQEEAQEDVCQQQPSSP